MWTGGALSRGIYRFIPPRCFKLKMTEQAVFLSETGTPTQGWLCPISQIDFFGKGLLAGRPNAKMLILPLKGGFGTRVVVRIGITTKDAEAWVMEEGAEYFALGLAASRPKDSVSVVNLTRLPGNSTIGATQIATPNENSSPKILPRPQSPPKQASPSHTRDMSPTRRATTQQPAIAVAD